MVEKESAYERINEKAQGGSSKGKGRPLASSIAKAVKRAIKDEAEVDLKGEEKRAVVVPTVADRIALLLKESEFDPEATALWKPEEHVLFLFLASAFVSKFGLTFLLISMFRSMQFEYD